MELLANFAVSFTGMFSACGTEFMGLCTSTIPLVMVLMTLMNAIVNKIGEDRVMRTCAKLTKYWFARWCILPCVRVLIPGTVGYTVGRFLPERYKAAYCQCNMAFCHAIMGVFPHANPPEYFIFTAFATGIAAQGLNVGLFAIGLFITGMIVNIPRGFLTDRFFSMFSKALAK